MRKRRLFAVLTAAALLICACGDGTGGERNEMNPDAKSGYQSTEKGVTVTLTTDQESYQSGDSVKFVLDVRNDRRLWNIAEAYLDFTVSDGLKNTDDTVFPEALDVLGYGENFHFEGTLEESAGASVKHVSEAASGAKAFTGDDEVTIRPYVQFDYAGEEAMVRAVIKMTMRQVKRELADNEKNTVKRTSCHDPSIFKDKDGTYYIFGTHMGMSVSSDLISWENKDAEFRAGFTEEVKAQIRAWNDDPNAGNWYDYLWAPDIVYNETLQKYCMYLSADGDYWISNIVLLTADTVTGPYDYAGTVVYGGFTQETLADTDVPQVLGTDEIPERYVTNGVANRKWGDMYPNCIDPCVFFDDDGKLWMSYGSWSGGIFLLALDGKTGLRDYGVTYETDIHSDAYFGKKIAGGAYVSGEASYIQKIGDYYYLFVTYGGLSAKEGYNMRIFRSSTPDGEYLDELGNTPYYDTYSFNYNQNIGIRLFGAYKWRTFQVGQVAQGHNSAFVDDDGRAYLIYHTRTTDGTEGHYVRVHQLFVNRNGWLVAAPYHTGGEKLDPSLTAADIAGDYEVMLHRLDIDYANYDVVMAESMELHEDGTLGGAYEGTWEYEPETAYLTIRTEDETYEGVALPMVIEDSNIETMTFTALGESRQLTLWGSRTY